MHKWLVSFSLLLLPTVAAAEKPFAALLAAAEEGDRSAMVATGVAYYQGDGVEQDCYEARRWLKKAAAAGDVEANYRIGALDDDGRCGIGRAERAADFYRLAADRGHAGAQYRLGELYRTGRGVDQDTATALKWLEAAAVQNEPKAFCSLAHVYAREVGRQGNRHKALRWLQRGIASRDADAVELCKTIKAETGL